MSEEQYNAMTPEQQAAYWHQWQQYSQQYYATAPDQGHQYGQDPQYQAQYAQYQVRAHTSCIWWPSTQGSGCVNSVNIHWVTLAEMEAHHLSDADCLQYHQAPNKTVSPALHCPQGYSCTPAFDMRSKNVWLHVTITWMHAEEGRIVMC